jgi:hypothetical protein
MMGDVVPGLTLVFEATLSPLLLDEERVFEADETARKLDVVEAGEGTSQLRGFSSLTLGSQLCFVSLNFLVDPVPMEGGVVFLVMISAHGILAAILHVGQLV